MKNISLLFPQAHKLCTSLVFAGEQKILTSPLLLAHILSAPMMQPGSSPAYSQSPRIHISLNIQPLDPFGGTKLISGSLLSSALSAAKRQLENARLQVEKEVGFRGNDLQGMMAEATQVNEITEHINRKQEM